MSRDQLKREEHTRPDMLAAGLSGSKFAAALRDQLLSSSPPPSPSPPCAACTALGRLNCMHLSASDCAALRGRKMRLIPGRDPSRGRGGGAPDNGPPAAAVVVQVYSCPGRHAYSGAAPPLLVSGRHPPRGTREEKEGKEEEGGEAAVVTYERLRGMCPQCWDETLNAGRAGGRRPWGAQEDAAAALARRALKRPRRSKAWVVARRQRQERGGLGGGGEERREGGGGEKGKKGKMSRRRWRLSKVEEGNGWGRVGDGPPLRLVKMVGT